MATRSHVHLLSIKSAGAGIDIEAHQDFRGRGIETKHDLDMAVRELGNNRDGIGRAECQRSIRNLIAHSLINLIQLFPIAQQQVTYLLSLFFIQSVKEEINI